MRGLGVNRRIILKRMLEKYDASAALYEVKNAWCYTSNSPIRLRGVVPFTLILVLCVFVRAVPECFSTDHVCSLGSNGGFCEYVTETWVSLKIRKLLD
jgi:hypothetical protein